MSGLLETWRGLPKPARYLLLFVLILPFVILLARVMGLQRYWWMFALGLLIVLLVVLVVDLLMERRERGRGDAFEGDLRQDGERAGASREEVRQAVKELAARWSAAVKSLKQSGLSIYSLPWYLLIGEPQSGKSTTLKNSGLEFPLGAEALSGAGGTRNCDWWFSNEAVILDTAGRFTFQEEAAPDQSEWAAFLKLLRRHRKYCPINGVLVVVPCTSLLEDSAEVQEKKAANIRNKLLNLQRTLQIRFPVFILVTKADRVLGFAEFFSRLDPVDQRQLFGWSSPESPEKPFDGALFEESWEDLCTRVHKLRLKFVSGEETSGVDRLFVFPEELRALKAPLQRYLAAVFQATRYDEPFVFRGYYVTSGVQQGKPIAQATRDLLRGPSGTTDEVVESLDSIFKKSRAFFIKDFYEKKVFPEQGLISRTRAAEVAARKTVWAMRVLLVLVVLFVLGGMLPAWYFLSNLLGPIRTTVAAAQEECVAQPCSPKRAWELTKEIQQHRANVEGSRFTLAMFLRGARSGELNELLARVQRKLAVEGVALPLLRESATRMAALTWEGPPKAEEKKDPKAPSAEERTYRLVQDALEQHLLWWSLEHPAEKEFVVKPEELKLSTLLTFLRQVRSASGGEESAAVDELVGSLGATDPAPDRIVQSLAKLRGTATLLPKTAPTTGEAAAAIAPGPLVPDPAAAVAKLEDYWTVANLARWDFRLNDALRRWAEAHAEILGPPEPAIAGQVRRFAVAAKKLSAVQQEVVAHLGTARPGAGGFPGGDLEAWRKSFRASYEKLLRFRATASAVINDGRRDAILERLEKDRLDLDEQGRRFAFLLGPAGADGKPTLAKVAEQAGLLVADVGKLADLDAYAASEDGQILSALSRTTSWPEQQKKLEAWRDRQLEARRKAVEKGATLGADAPPPPPLRAPETRETAERTADLALVLRTVPTARTFFSAALVTACPPELCYSSGFARQMIPLASSFVTFAESLPSISVPEVRTEVNGIAALEVDYLTRLVGQAERSLPKPPGAPQVISPSGLRSASSWRAYQSAIASWPIVSQGGGGEAPPPSDAAPITLADVQAWAQANAALAPLTKLFRERIEGPRTRPAGAPKPPPPDVVAAAEEFRKVVSSLSDQPLKAWKQLAGNLDGASLKSFHALSQPRVRAQASFLADVERQGSRHLREALAPMLAAKADPLVKRLADCCSGKFPFVTEREVRQLAERYRAGQLARKLELPTVSQADVTGVLSEAAALVDEFSLGPLLSGEEPELDFLGDRRAALRVVHVWDRFLNGGGPQGLGGGGPREVKVEVVIVERPVSSGRKFVGDRAGEVTLFDRGVRIRPSTDLRSPRAVAPGFSWRLAGAEGPLNIFARNEGAGVDAGRLEILGGPLRFFYFLKVATEERRPGQDERVYTIRAILPAGAELLEGVFEVRLSAPLPGVLSE